MMKYKYFTKEKIAELKKLSQLNLADLRKISNEQLINLIVYYYKFPMSNEYIVRNDENFNENACHAVRYHFKFKIQYVIGCIFYLLENIGKDKDCSFGVEHLMFILYPWAYPIHFCSIKDHLEASHKYNPFDLKKDSEFIKFTEIKCKLIFTVIERIFQDEIFAIPYVDRYAIAYFWFHLSKDKSINKINIGESIWDGDFDEIEEFLIFYNLSKL
ncbi:hypothetical protein AAEX28_15455 [Lentisphaerota bacterium WC36G]|nr:hypothetical protein LJT99_02210 [Lentisphaerae bacterium WC36]